MKNVLLLSFFLLPIFNVFADAPDTSRKLTDIMYMPEKGKMQGSSKIVYANEQSTLRSKTSNINTNENDDTTMTFEQEFNYGMMDNFYFGFKLGYQFSGSFESKSLVTSAITKTETKGIVDPEFYGQYRLFNHGQDFMNIDFKVTLSPALVPAEDGNATTDGSPGRGGFLFKLETEAGQQYKDYAWKGRVEIAFNGTRTIENAGTGIDETEFDSVLNLTLGGAAQIRMDEDMSFDVEADATLSGSQTQTTIASRAKVENDSSLDFLVRGRFNYIFIEETLAFSLDAAWKKNGSFDIKPTTGTSTQERIERTEILGGFKATYQF
jgi:hypothetical protein